MCPFVTNPTIRPRPVLLLKGRQKENPLNQHDTIIANTAKTLALNFAEFLHQDDDFIEALHIATTKYVESQGIFSEEAELDIAMELVMRVTVLADWHYNT